ncbi:MAG: DNA polymerase III subunit chi [Pseudomonadota bacterium]|nr:DNA polymerase III subunit chi [Pseudomonadota bacterium]
MVKTISRVDFYILASENQASRLLFACRLSEKAYRMKKKVYAHTKSINQAEELNRMLWTFRNDSFVPHECINRNQSVQSPIKIGTPEVYSDSGEILINLCEVVPTFSEAYQRIVEIITSNKDALENGRKRFQHYRNLGLEPDTHNIT